MWTRKELKEKAKVSFKANYWKAVLVALLIAMLTCGFGATSSMGNAYSMPSSATYKSSSYQPENVNVEIKDGKLLVDVEDNNGKVHVDLDAEDAMALGGVSNLDSESIRNAIAFTPGKALAGLSVFLIMLVMMALAVALYVFVFSPLRVGAARFFLRNLNQTAEVKEVAFGYDNNYKENVKAIFLRSLFIFLWSLLLIIPGIYKAYEYRMIPYLLADDPTMTKDRAFAESKRLMDGQKWNAFVLDLSFIGWHILSLFTLGILGVFYVNPYQEQTNAALFEKLRYSTPAPEMPTPGAPFVTPSQPPVPPFATTGMQSAAPQGTAPMGGVAPVTGITTVVPTAPAETVATIVPPLGSTQPVDSGSGEGENNPSADSPQP